MYYNHYRKNYRRSDGLVELTMDEEREVDQLVQLFKSLGMTKSAEVSRYIRDHKLGFQFQHISGYLELTREDEDGVDTWEFEGGIKPKFYKAVCQRLNLTNQGSDAKVTGFESYRERHGWGVAV